jgi:hypothetical protein
LVIDFPSRVLTRNLDQSIRRCVGHRRPRGGQGRRRGAPRSAWGGSGFDGAFEIILISLFIILSYSIFLCSHLTLSDGRGLSASTQTAKTDYIWLWEPSFSSEYSELCCYTLEPAHLHVLLSDSTTPTSCFYSAPTIHTIDV